MDFLVALDGGGSRTRALALSPAGNLLGFGLGGPSAFVSAGGQVVFDSVRQALEEALPQDLQRASGQVVFCLGGGNTAEAVEAVQVVLPASKVSIVGELQCALEVAAAYSLKLVVLAGTGVIAGAACGDEILSCGGMGAFTGDEGGGFFLGWEAVRAALRDLDGRGPSTQLTRNLLLDSQLARATQRQRAEVEALLGAPSVRERRPLAFALVWGARAMGRHHIGALAPYVARAATAGDAVARDILAQAGAELARYAISLGRQLKAIGTPVDTAGFMGSVLQAGPALVSALEASLNEAVPSLKPSRLPHDLVLGAGLLGLRQMSAVELTPETERKFVVSWSGAASWPRGAAPEWQPPAEGGFGPGSLGTEFGSIA